MSTAKCLLKTAGIMPVALLFAAGLLFLAACGNADPTNTAPAGDDAALLITAASHDPIHEPGPDVTLSDESIYVLDAVWETQRGTTTELAALHGTPVLASMVFTHCAYACPMIVHDMKEIAARLPDELQQELRFLLVTIDPERDTPEVLERFSAAHGLDPERWTFLIGDATDVRILAAMLGIKYKAGPDGQFSHSNIITLLDSEGAIVHRHEGLRRDPTRIVNEIDRLLTASMQ